MKTSDEADEAMERDPHDGTPTAGEAGDDPPDGGSGAEGTEGRIAALEEELVDMRERYLRAEAELQNVLKRHAREVGERARYAAQDLARDLLGVIDDLDRALEHAPPLEEAQGQAQPGGEGGSVAGLVEGVRMVREGLLSVLERHGISRLDAQGRLFDPGEHEAVAVIESREHEPNTVVDEHRAGYRIHDRLLRPAMVAVSKAPAEDDGDK